MTQAPTVIRNASWVVAWDAAAASHVYRRDIDLAFADDTITAIGAVPPQPDAVEIDGRGCLIMPGLIDLHAHPSSEPMLKGLTDEVGSRQLFMSSLYEYLPLFTADTEGRRAANEVALCELLQSGVTTLCDLSSEREDWLDTLGESGIRAWIAPMYRSGRWYTTNGREVRYEWDESAGQAGFDQALRTIERARQHPTGRLSGMLCPAQIDTCSEALLRDSAAVGRERRLPLQIHAAQSVVEFYEIMRRHGQTPIEWLETLGVLGANAIIGHAIFLDHHSWLHWPTRDDLPRLAATGTNVAHCPTVFSRRGITLEHFGAYRAAGVNLGIGTDTFPHNLIEEMRTAILAARFVARDIRAADPGSLLHAATVAGSQALLRDDLGRIAIGAKADLALVDLNHPLMQPVRDPLRSLVYHAADRAVRTVLVDGVVAYDNGKALGLDVASAAATLAEAQARMIRGCVKHDYRGRSGEEISPPSLPVA